MFLGLSPPHAINQVNKTISRLRTGDSARVLAATGWPWSERPILLAGAPRTGTSWTAKVISLGRNIRYMREPVSQGGFENGFRGIGYRYLVAGDTDDEYAAVWRVALSRMTMISQRWLLGETRPLLRRMPFWPARLLVKEVNCPFALDWLAEHFKLKIVLTIRHPCGYVASALRVKSEGDSFVSLDQLLRQPRLIADYFVDDYDWLSNITDPIAQMAAWYGMVYKVLSEQLARHPEWTLVRHETFCEDPSAQFRRLFQELGIRHSNRVDEHLRLTSQESDGNLYSFYRKTADEPDKWKRELSTQQIDTIAAVIARFRLPFYREFA